METHLTHVEVWALCALVAKPCHVLDSTHSTLDWMDNWMRERMVRSPTALNSFSFSITFLHGWQWIPQLHPREEIEGRRGTEDLGELKQREPWPLESSIVLLILDVLLFSDEIETLWDGTIRTLRSGIDNFLHVRSHLMEKNRMEKIVNVIHVVQKPEWMPYHLHRTTKEQELVPTNIPSVTGTGQHSKQVCTGKIPAE